MILIVGPTVWGRGETEEKALKEVIKVNGRKKPKQLIYYKVDDPKVYVNEMGYICYASGKKLEEFKRVGFKEKK